MRRARKYYSFAVLETFTRATGFAVLGAIFLGSGTVRGVGYDIPINPAATFLRTDPEDTSAQDAVAVNLAALGLLPQTEIQLLVYGDYQAKIGVPDDRNDLIAVFGADGVLLSRSLLVRVKEPMAVGLDVATPVTFPSGLTTDFPQDFAVVPLVSPPDPPGVRVVIPVDATHLFFSPLDDFFGDNTDPDQDFAVVISPVPEAGASPTLPDFMLGLLGGEGVNSPASILAEEHLTNISCGFVEQGTATPAVPERLGLTSGMVPDALNNGETVDLTFDCDASSAGYEVLDYRCSADQGYVSMRVECLVNALNVLPFVSSVDGVQGNPPPTWGVDFRAVNVGLTNLSCDFLSAPQRIRVSGGSIPLDMTQGTSTTLEYSCSTDEAGDEIALLYVCGSDQGSTVTAHNCSIRGRFPVEPLPETAAMAANEGDPDPTIVVNMTADGEVVTNIAGCGFYDDDVNLVTPAMITLLSGEIPDEMTATQSVALTFDCDTSVPGEETVTYGCGSNLGVFGVRVHCAVENVSQIVIPPAAMQGSVGAENPSADASVEATDDLGVLACAFVDKDTLQPIAPTHISLNPPGAPATLNAGEIANLNFSCDASIEGVEEIIWGCLTESGQFGMSVFCEILPSNCPGYHCGMMRGWRLRMFVPDG